MSSSSQQKSYRNQMDVLLEKFNVNPTELHELLKKTGCFIAGGAATHLLMGRPVQEFDGDLDIWYPHAPHRDGQYSEDQVRSYHDAKAAFDAFMHRLNRSTSALTKDVTQQYLDQDNSLNHVIRKIRSYNQTNDTCPIQVIYAFGDRDQILNSFDFSFCAIGYDPNTGQIFGKDLELTKSGKGFVLNEARNDTRRAGRLAKYERRGFRLA